MKIQYIALTIFSNRGGIEQVSKNWLYTLNSLKDNFISKVSVLYDNCPDDNYISSNKFTGYSGNKFWFILKSVFIGTQSEINIFSHIHLSIVALLIKLLHPSSKIIFQLHGIEVWRKLSYIQKKALTICSQIICVSEFTKNKLLVNYPELTNKTIVINNSLDPFVLKAYQSKLREDFRSQLSYKPDDKLLISVSRLNYNEAYKGYDKVIESLYHINNPKIHYHIIGKYDNDEYKRVSNLIAEYKLEDQVKLVGYVDDDILNKYFNAADVLAMPSNGEGFGIVFIESMYRGLRVLAGNADGSVDAVADFKDSKLVNPDLLSENLCLAGGVGQNSVANGKIIANTSFKNLYIPPAAHDAGTAIGAALYVYHQLLNQKRNYISKTGYYGYTASDDEIKRLLDDRNIEYKYYDDQDQLVDYVTDKIIDAKVIGWYQGRAEFGPRALGHRSIIADPRRNDAKEILNLKIKRRESFRPFAPSILK